jgi:hypothetical protein
MSQKHNNKRNNKTHEFNIGDFVAVIIPQEKIVVIQISDVYLVK